MATPTISEYTAHLRQDKVGMREYMRIAGVDTKESDTFTNLTEKVLNVAGAQRQVYIQPNEPQAKEGIWFQTEQLTDFDVVSDPVPFVNEVFSSDTKNGYNPDASNTGSKSARYYVVKNVPYYLVFDQGSATRPNNSYRFYRYNKDDNSYTLVQSYSASEIIAVRGQTKTGGSYDLAINHCAVCIDDDQEYLYLVGGGYSTTVTDDPTRKCVIRFGLKTHNISKVFTLAKPFFVIGGASAWQCNCFICATKIFIFGYHDTNSGAYGATSNAKIIDLAAGDGNEYTKSYGPISFGGTALKFNNELIVGFGGGNSSQNSGSGMNHVRLFNTLTESTKIIYYLANKVNQRAICAVGSLIYFAEYTNAANNFGCVNLEDNTVRYIDKGNTPSYNSISAGTPYYDEDLNCIMFGSYVGTKYPFILTTKDYKRDTVVIFQASYETAAYKTNIFTTNNFKSDVKLGFSNTWLYKTDVGIDKTIKRYYGTGTEWIEITEESAFGGNIDVPILQDKSVEITENGTTTITADKGYDGLNNVDVTVNVEGGEVTPVDPDYITDGLIAWWEGADGFDENAHWNSRVGDDYISVDGYAFGTANDNNLPRVESGAVYNDGVFSMVTQVDYCKTGYTVQVVGYSEGVVADAGTDMCTFIGFNMSSSPMIGLKNSSCTLWTANGYQPNHEVLYDNFNKKILNASLHLVNAPTRGVNSAFTNLYSLNGQGWKASSLSSSAHNSQGNNMTVLSYYTANWRAVGARVYSIRVYNRKLTEEELQHNYEIDKARFNIKE